MGEMLAIPSWDASPATLDDWKSALQAEGADPRIGHEEGAIWLEVPALRLRGFVELEGANVEAINFELPELEDEAACRLLVAAARRLNWEVHPDEPEDDDVDED